MAGPTLSDATARNAGASGGANAVHARLAAVASAFRPQSASPAIVPVRASTITALFMLTVLINTVAIATPLVTLAVVDNVIRAGAHVALALLAVTGGLAILQEMLMRRQRLALAAQAGLRLTATLSIGVFGGLVARTDKTTPNAHLARFRALRRLRRFATGRAAAAVMDAPFSLILMVLLAVYFGPIALAPLGALIGHVALMRALQERAAAAASRRERARDRLNAALAESVTRRDTLEEMGALPGWQARIESLAVDSTLRAESAATLAAARDAAGRGLTMLTVIGTVWIGAERVMDGAMTVGALLAAVMLVWRCAAAIDAAFGAVRDAQEAAAAALEARRAVADRAAAGRLPAPDLRGAVAVRGLVVRGEEGSPALRGVSFDVAPGELVAVCGPAGSGKSALLTSLLGLTKPESGSILIDGCDLRGLDIEAYRAQVAWAPPRTTLFHGAVSQNIRLLAPAADAGSVERALQRAGVALPHPQLPDGVETRLMSGGGGQVDESLRTRIMLAGLYARDAKLYLLDDPGAFLDRDGDAAFIRALGALRGRATVILVTNRPSHMRACDRIIRLEHGMVVTDGRVEQVLG